MIDKKRGPTELVQHLVYRGSSHWRKDAARLLFDIVWLHRSVRSPILVGERGVFILLVQMISNCLSSALRKGGG
jgi:hypothetical protein